MKISKRQLKRIIKEETGTEDTSAVNPQRKPFGQLSYGPGEGAHIEDEEGNIYLIIDVRQKMGSYRPVRVIKNVATGKVRNLPVGEFYSSFYPVTDQVKEGIYKKLNNNVENTMKISKRQLKQIIKEEKQKLIKEGIHEKLSDDATGSGMNLDQEVYFGLEEGVLALIRKFADNPRYSQHGVTGADVLEELKNVISEIGPRDFGSSY